MPGKTRESAPACRSKRQRMRGASDDLKHAEVSAFRFTEFGQLALGGKGGAGERAAQGGYFRFGKFSLNNAVRIHQEYSCVQETAPRHCFR